MINCTGFSFLDDNSNFYSKKRNINAAKRTRLRMIQTLIEKPEELYKNLQL